MSRRMGQDKGSMKINKKPMIIHVLDTLNSQINEAIIVLNNKERIAKYKKFINEENYDYSINFVEDLVKDKGPISGIMTGLKNIKNDYALVLPCDNPFISKKSINYLFENIDSKYDGIIAYNNDENKIKSSEPLHSIYHKSLVDIIEKLINENILNVKSLIEKIRCKFILIDNKNLYKKDFKNLNSLNDLKKEKSKNY